MNPRQSRYRLVDLTAATRGSGDSPAVAPVDEMAVPGLPTAPLPHLHLVETNPDDSRLLLDLLRLSDLRGAPVQLQTAPLKSPGHPQHGAQCVLLPAGLHDELSALSETAPDCAVIVFDHTQDEGRATAALQRGAQDYLVLEHLTSQTLARAVRHAVLRKHGERSTRQALRDPLTGLPNRDVFDDRLRHALADRARPTAVMFIDLDNFKGLNDSLGHLVGDQALRAVADRLARAVRGGDTVARFAGDEFTVLLPRLHSPTEGTEVGQRILSSFSEPIHLGGRPCQLSVSIGLAISTSTGDDPDVLLSQADAALYRSKALGKDRLTVFDDGLRSETMERSHFQDELALAVDCDQLALSFEPEIDLRTGEVRAVEALLRWVHPARGVLVPGEFLDLAEQSGLILSIGRWVLREACRQRMRWEPDSAGLVPPVSVNISATELHDPGLLSAVATALDVTGCPASALQLEVSEKALLQYPRAKGALTALHALGVGLTIDDFGTGHSSLDLLTGLPATAVKLDRCLIDPLSQDPADLTKLKAIISVAHSAGLRVVAEGIENVQQLDVLLQMGCERGQGYLLALNS